MTSPALSIRTVKYPAWIALACFFSVATSAGCAKREAPQDAMSQSAPAMMAAPGAKDAKAATDGRAMRITVESSIVVRDVEAAARGLRVAVERQGGYVSESRLSGSSESRSGSFELRVPSAKLDALRADLAGLGEVAAEVEKAEDVTEQRADLAARMRNARAGEKRLLDLLAERTGSLADVMAVEKELAAEREKIERMDAEVQALEHQIAFATVKVQLSQQSIVVATGPAGRIGNAFGDGIQTAGAFAVGLVVFTASAGPTLLIVAALAFGLFRAGRFVVRRRRSAVLPPLTNLPS